MGHDESPVGKFRVDNLEVDEITSYDGNPVVFDKSITLNNSSNIAIGTSTGSEIGTATNQKIGFWGLAPVTQPSVASNANVATLIAALSGAGIVSGHAP
ncbi:MAG: hypothetical protein HOG49_20975 [Candidatus Scalindua sp.]|nr:hypothetical protein [Candidatus Scalindua sp.]